MARLAFALATLILVALVGGPWAHGLAAQNPAPDRGPDEGEGPFDRMVIRGATVIDGRGGPPRSPVDIVIEGNRVTSVRTVGFPGVEPDPDRGPEDVDHEIDGEGMYVLPGFVDMHAHAGGGSKAPDAEYAYKLWLAHGITTARGVGLGGYDFSMSEQERSANNEIVAPRIVNYQRPGAGWDEGPIRTPEAARQWVRWAAEQGVDGMKLGASPPPIMEALLDEAHAQGLGSTAHLGQDGVAEMNARDATALGLETVTHFYGHFEALLKDHTIQDFPVDHDHMNEYDRFAEVARLWDAIHEPRGEEWWDLLEHYRENEVTMDPTMTIYEANRNLMAARNADWHDEYTLPSLWEFFEADRTQHGSYFFDWTSEDEAEWTRFFTRWQKLINDYKNMGGRVTLGSDSGFIYKTYGFGYIEEMELLQETGFNPLEVVRAATWHGAETIHLSRDDEPEFGAVAPGMLADLVIVDENPLQNFKVLYGTGHLRLNDETNELERVGGVNYTVKDGIVYDAEELLADVREMVRAQEAERAEDGR